MFLSGLSANIHLTAIPNSVHSRSVRESLLFRDSHTFPTALSIMKSLLFVVVMALCSLSYANPSLRAKRGIMVGGPPSMAVSSQMLTRNIPACPGGPSLGIPCDAKRPWPACPPQSYCYNTNSVDIGPYYCCPVWSTYGAQWRPTAPFYNYYPPMPYNWPDIIKMTARWPGSAIMMPRKFNKNWAQSALQRSLLFHKAAQKN